MSREQWYRPCSACKEVRNTTGYKSCKKSRACSLFEPRLIELSGKTDWDELVADGQSLTVGHMRASAHFSSATQCPNDSVAFISFLQKAHSMIFQEALPQIAGRFRQGNETVFFGGEGKHQMQGVAAVQIEEELGKLFERFLSRLAQVSSTMPLARVMAHFLEEFFLVHPFLDGNGRVARLFLVSLADREGYKFQPQVNHKTKRSYVKALEYAHNRCDRVKRRRKVDNPVLPLERWIQKALLPHEQEDTAW